jgi:hypothetical protein
MPKYEFITSVTYTKFVVVEADSQDAALHIACETRDADIINEGDHGFDCVFNGEVENA